MTRPSFRPLVSDTAAALSSGSDAAALATFRAESSQAAGLRSNVKIRDFRIGVD